MRIAWSKTSLGPDERLSHTCQLLVVSNLFQLSQALQHFHEFLFV